MANVFFKKGLLANLPESYAAGTFYVTTDERAMYLDIDDSTRIRLGDFIQVDAVANLPTAGASTSALYYCVAENILAKWNGSAWTQINKQPTAEEMKTLLGLGTMAYKSEVAEGDLNADLKAKVNAAAEGNHSHDNKALLDTYTQTEADLADAVAKKHSHSFADETALNGITAAKVADWDDAVSKEHTHTFADTDVEDAISKKHAHTFVESELNKIAAGDVAKWNGVVADHLTSADKTAIEDEIGDVNTSLENYKTSNNEALAGVKATAEAAATKVYTDAELAKKVDKVEGKDLISTSEIERLATLHNYDDTQVKADIAKKADSETMTTELGKKVDKVEGYSLVSDTEIARLAGVTNYDDSTVKADIAKKADAATMTTELGKKVDKVTGYSLVSDAEIARLAGVDNYDDSEIRDALDAKADNEFLNSEFDKLKMFLTSGEEFGAWRGDWDFGSAADLTMAVSNHTGQIRDIETLLGNDTRILGTVTQAVADLQSEITYKANAADIGELPAGTDATTVIEYIDAKTSNIASDETVGAIEERVKAIEDDYLTSTDKTALQDQITANANAINVITNGIDADKIDGLNDLIEWADTHAPEVNGIKTDIETNAKAIEDEASRADAAEKLLAGRLDILEAIDHDAYVDADATLKSELNAEIAKKADASTVTAMDEAYKAADTALSGRIKDLEDNKAGYATTSEVATAKGEAIAEAEGKVNALAGNVYTKEQTYTQAEVDALIQQAHQWGSF